MGLRGATKEAAKREERGLMDGWEWMGMGYELPTTLLGLNTSGVAADDKWRMKGVGGVRAVKHARRICRDSTTLSYSAGLVAELGRALMRGYYLQRIRTFTVLPLLGQRLPILHRLHS